MNRLGTVLVILVWLVVLPAELVAVVCLDHAGLIYDFGNMEIPLVIFSLSPLPLIGTLLTLIIHRKCQREE